MLLDTPPSLLAPNTVADPYLDAISNHRNHCSPFCSWCFATPPAAQQGLLLLLLCRGATTFTAPHSLPNLATTTTAAAAAALDLCWCIPLVTQTRQTAANRLAHT
jgi:hypothetical protein